MTDSDEPTDLQHRILDTAADRPNASAEEIAAVCDCSEQYVHETLGKYGDPGDDPNPFGGWF